MEFDSLIIKDTETQQKFIKELFEENTKLELVFRGSRDSFTCDKFHEKLENLSNLVFLI